LNILARKQDGKKHIQVHEQRILTVILYLFYIRKIFLEGTSKSSTAFLQCWERGKRGRGKRHLRSHVLALYFLLVMYPTESFRYVVSFPDLSTLLLIFCLGRLPDVKYGVRSPKFIWGWAPVYVQLYSLAETP
jgi:hypothetical protein